MSDPASTPERSKADTEKTPATLLDALAALGLRQRREVAKELRKVAEMFAEVRDGRDTAHALQALAHMLGRHSGDMTTSEPTSVTRMGYTCVSTVAQTLDQQR